MTGFRLPGMWPLPADQAAADALTQALYEPSDDEAPIPRNPETTALLACLGGNSAFLSDLARRERSFLGELLRQGPARATARVLRRLRALSPRTDRLVIASEMRRAKRQVALAVAIADIGGIWELERVTEALSQLAEASLRVATAHLLFQAARAGLIRLPHPRQPEKGSGFVVLAMGKLGAHELNYSSDIDLVLLYDPAAHQGVPELGRIFARMAADLVSLMEARDADGYVFRMDLRLRPDPGATPPAVSLPAAIAYYESYGQTWERAAMTKARPVAGDLACGERFLETIRPFVWRRHLDFAAIEDIHAMKRRIDRHKPSPAKAFSAPGSDDPVGALLGHDLKLGFGGIREIEFVAQTLQLVWAGREPALRDPTTLGGLHRLAAGGYLNRATARSLAQTYRRLRSLEHRLQMQADRQTHDLPATRAGFEAFALFTGAPDGDTLARALLPELRRTRRRFERMVRSQVAAPDASGGSRPWGDDTASDSRNDFEGPEGVADLEAIGFTSGIRARDILRGWQTDRYRALRQPRARALLDGLTPTLLRALAGQRDPMGALIRFDTLLSRQSSGLQLLSLFDRHPPLLDRIATVLGAAPSLADHLAAVPGALDGLLVPERDPQAARIVLGILDRQMRAAAGVDEAIRIARALVRGEEFRLSVAQMEGRLDSDAAGIARTALAVRVINRMLHHVQADHRRRYGSVPGGGMSVVALGKAGSREMMSGSDLDLMLIYDHPADILESVAGPARGGRPARPLASSQYYTRLAHGLIAALSAPGLEGPLYALDMRLRPSGNKGPVAVSLAAFRRYHAEQAWTWERMALSRARVVAGPAALRRRVGDAIAVALSTIPDPAGEAYDPVALADGERGDPIARGAATASAEDRPARRPIPDPAARRRPATAARQGSAPPAPDGRASIIALEIRSPLLLKAAAPEPRHDPATAPAGTPIHGHVGPPEEPGRDPSVKLRRDAAAMRARLARDLPPDGIWDVKRRAGGLMEVEFIAQILQLASPDPTVRHPTTRIAFRRLCRAGLLDPGDASMLIEADRFWRRLQGMLRILLGVQIPHGLRGGLPVAVAEALLRGLSPGAPEPDPDAGLDALEARCALVATAVREAFERLVGPIPTL